MVLVIFENDLIKVGTVLTVGDADQFMKDELENLVPFKFPATRKEEKQRFDFIKDYRKKIIHSMELKN